MGNPFDEIKRQGGLYTHGNPLNAPDGAMLVADEAEILREDMVTRRRGYSDFSTNLPDFRPEQLISIGDQLFLNLDSGLWYWSGSQWLRKLGDFGTALKNPNGVLVLNGHMYVTSTSNVVFDYDLSTGSRSIIAGRYNASGSTDGTGTAARFNNPYGITTDGTNLYVVDSGNSTIRRLAPPLTAGGAVVTTICGTAGSPGSADGTGAVARFSAPSGITCDGISLYVCDYTNNLIRRVAPPLTAGAGVVTTIAGAVGASAGTDGTGAAARFGGPVGIVMLGTALFVADQAGGAGSIRRLAPPLTAGAAVVTTICGLYGSPGSSNGTGTAARFDDPQGIATDGTNLYVTDGTNTTIRKVVPPLTAGAATVSTLAGSAGSPGTTDGIGASARFIQPLGLAYSGNALLIADGTSVAGLIRKLYLDTLYVATIDGVSNRIGATAGLPVIGGFIQGPT